MSAPLRVLQFGTTGQLARELQLAAGPEVELTCISRAQVDFRWPEDVAEAVHAAGKADIVINAVAYTAVDKAESDVAAARLVNEVSVGEMARACRRRGIPLIHISTDYVFDGSKHGDYVETDEPNPINVYGETKFAGERRIRQELDAYVIVRTSWLYSAIGTNFVTQLLKMSNALSQLRVVDDEVGKPTAACDLALTILEIAWDLNRGQRTNQFGIFHYAGEEAVSRYQFARTILAKVPNISTASLVAIKSEELESRAKRPQNSRLDCKKIAGVFGIKPMNLMESLDRILYEIDSNRPQREAEI